MSRHSKNNTAHSVFSYKEKKQLEGEYGTLAQRLGQDSWKPFSSCGLCLKKVKVPFVCEKGHLFCKDCIVENMV